MAITAEARTEIIALVVGMFGAAPGASVLSDLVAAREAGMTLKGIAASVSNTNEFKSMFPTFLTNAEYATKLVDNLVGSLVPATDKANAVIQITALLAAAPQTVAGRSSVTVDVITALNSVPSTHAVFGAAALAFDNKVDVANYYSVIKQQSGTSLAQLQAVVASVTNDAASVTAAKTVVDSGSNVGQTFTFTTGVDAAAGGAGDDTINANSTIAGATFTELDNVNGGAGNDTLNIFNTAAITLPASATVINVENANIVSAGALNGNVSGWTGLTKLVAVATGAATGQALTAAATTDVTFSNSTSFGATTTGGAISVTGGKTVSITNALEQTALGATTTGGAITVSGGAGTTAVTVNQTAPVTSVATVVAVAGATEVATLTGAGGLTATQTYTVGGLTYTSTGVTTQAELLTAFASLANGATTGGGTATGTYSGTLTGYTTSAVAANVVTFTSATANTSVADIAAAGTGAAAATVAVTTQGVTTVAAVAGTKGIVNGDVTITDTNSASTTAAGVITTVDLSNFANATVNSGALTTVNLSGKGGTFNAGTLGALTTATATATVGLNVNGLTTTGAVTFDADVKTLNVAAVTAASTLNSLSATGATAVNLSGDKALTLTGNTFAATAVITSTNTAGVTVGTAIAAGSQFVGGAGADTITLTVTGTKAITTGAGNDTVTYAGVIGTGGSVDAGEGTDTIKMTAAQAVTATATTAFAATVSNFEVLEISAATGAAAAINLTNADGINSLTSNGVTVGALTVTNAAANFTFTQKAATDFASSIALATDVGTTDNVNLAYSAAAGFTSTAALTIANVESLTITTADSSATTANTGIVTPITAAAATTVTISGALGVSLIGGMTQTVLTSLDASGLTGTTAASGLTWTSGALAAAATVKGGAAGTNTIDFSAATKVVTYTGGTGIDTINFASANAQANVVNLGNGVNSFNGGTNATGNNNITGGTGVDTILVANGNNTINAGAGLDVITIGTGSNSLTLGAGNDTVIFSAASSSSAVFTTIADIAAGDILNFAAIGVLANADGKLGAALVSGVNDYQTFLNAAAGKAAGTVSWFQFGGDTFIVQEVAGNAVFNAGADHVVKLTGLVDLSNSTIVQAAETLTIV